jgi:hypothetical protein
MQKYKSNANGALVLAAAAVKHSSWESKVRGGGATALLFRTWSSAVPDGRSALLNQL